MLSPQPLHQQHLLPVLLAHYYRALVLVLVLILVASGVAGAMVAVVAVAVMLGVLRGFPSHVGVCVCVHVHVRIVNPQQ